MADFEKRKYRRLSASWGVKIRATHYAIEDLRRMRDRIKNVSLGGVFIETAVPLAVGTHVEFSFPVPGRSDEVQAKGIVRWANDGRRPDEPVGMGVEFLEVTARTKTSLRIYLTTIASHQIIGPLLQSPLHQTLLRYYANSVGVSVPLDVAVRYLHCTAGELLEVLKDFLKMGLVAYTQETVQFLRPRSAAVQECIEHWCGTAKRRGTKE